MVALRRRVDDQRELIDSFQTQVTAVRSEIMEWKALHSQMWEALGPEAGPEQTRTGVGGGTPDAETPTASVEPFEGELELLATTVAEEGPRLRELERVISRTGRLMSALPLRWPVRGPAQRAARIPSRSLDRPRRSTSSLRAGCRCRARARVVPISRESSACRFARPW